MNKYPQVDNYKMQPYWCYICQLHFKHMDSKECIQCPICHELATEKVTEQIKPEKIHIQTITNTNTNQQQNMRLINGDMMWSQVFRNIHLGMIDFIGNIRIQFENSHSSSQAATSLQLQQLIKVNQVQQCAICQQNSQPQKIGYQLDCGHIFHQACIEPWFARANTCPKCRTALPSS